jgi:hypothetical protein
MNSHQFNKIIVKNFEVRNGVLELDRDIFLSYFGRGFIIVAGILDMCPQKIYVYDMANIPELCLIRHAYIHNEC